MKVISKIAKKRLFSVVVRRIPLTVKQYSVAIVLLLSYLMDKIPFLS